MNPILLRNVAWLATFDEADSLHTGVDVRIDGTRITSIQPHQEESLEPDQVEIIDASRCIALPGLVNTHHHLYQSLTRNLPVTQNAKLFDWLVGLYPIWAELDGETVYWSTLLGGAELLLSGCTTTSDHHYLFPAGAPLELLDAQAEAVRKLGIRFTMTRGSMSRGQSQGGLPPDRVVQTADAILEDSLRVIERHHDSDPFAQLHVGLAPCSPFSVTGDLMRQTAHLARQHGVLLHTHLAETEDENDYCLQHYGKRPLALLQDWDWLGEDVWLAHGIFFNDEEIELLAQSRTGISHCPSSNMRLGSGFARIPEMRRRGVRLGLGVDGSASNDGSNLLAEVRQALLLNRIAHGAEAMSAAAALRLATRGGAQLLQRQEAIGSLEVGKAADIILLRLDALEFAGALSDPLAALVFAGRQERVFYNIVGGRILVRCGQLTPVDEDDLARQGHRQSFRLLEKAGIDSPPPPWI